MVGLGLDHRQLESAEAHKKAGSQAIHVLGLELEALRIDIIQGQVATAWPQARRGWGRISGRRCATTLSVSAWPAPPTPSWPTPAFDPLDQWLRQRQVAPDVLQTAFEVQ